MAPKKRAHIEASSSSTFDHSRFPSLGKSKQFSTLFANRGVESEREVADDLHSTLEFRSLALRNWFSLVKFNTTAINVEWVREFFCNMELLDSGSVKTFIREKTLTISTADIAEFLSIPQPNHPDYPISSELPTPIDYDHVTSTLCGVPTRWAGGLLLHGNLTDEYRFLNRFVCSNIEPRGHTSDISQLNGYLLFCIGTGKAVDIPQVILNGFIRTLSAKKNQLLPFGVLVTDYLTFHEISPHPNDLIMKIKNPINARTLSLSTSHVPIGPTIPDDDEDDIEGEQPQEQQQQPQQPQFDQYAHLTARVDYLTERVDTIGGQVTAGFTHLNTQMTEGFTRVDTTLAELLSRLAPRDP